MSSADPLGLAELSVDAVQARIDKNATKTKPPSELELQKEARLAEKEKRLTAKSTAKAPPPEAPPPAPPPQQDRSVLLDKIGAYRERFPFLKKRNNVTAKSTIDEIIDEVHYCELQLGSQGGANQMSSTVLYGAMTGLETLTRDYWNPLGLNLTGLGMVTQQNMDQFQPILDELMIKHNAGVYTSPEWRLALAMGATILTVNAANSNPEMAQAVKAMNQAVTPPPGGKDL